MLVLMGQKPLLITVMILGVLSTTTRYTSDARGWSALINDNYGISAQTDGSRLCEEIEICYFFTSDTVFLIYCDDWMSYIGKNRFF